MLLVACFCLSLSALAFEVLLTRLLAYSQWNHLSFMVISLALFGFAASGTLLSLLDLKHVDWRRHAIKPIIAAGCCLLFAVSLLGGVHLFHLMPLDYFKITLQPIQTAFLLCAYLLLAAPFLFTGLVITAAFGLMPQRSGRVYFSTMAGSACGAMLPLFMLPLFDIGWLIYVLAVFPLATILLFWRLFDKPASGNDSRNGGSNTKSVFAVVAMATVVALLGLLQHQMPLKPRPSEYKAIHHPLKFPGTRLTASRMSLRGRFDSLKSPYIRFAPGLSLSYTGTLPTPTVVFKDGDRPLFLFDSDREEEIRFVRATLTYSGYATPPLPESALIIQIGGGLAVPCALAAGIDRIKVLAPSPAEADRIRTHYGKSTLAGSIRRHTQQMEESFDVIHVENWGTSLPETAVLDQDHSLTLNAMTAYWRLLSDHGRLVVSRKLLLPPADMLRLWASAFECMASQGVVNPAAHIAILRNWDTYTMIVSKNPYTDVAQLVDFAVQHYFDLVYLPDVCQDMINRFAVLDEPFFAQTVSALSAAYRSGSESSFFQRYRRDVAPQSDDRPFPYRFFKWRFVDELFDTSVHQPYTLLLSGEMVILVVLVEAMLCALLMLVIPAGIYRRQLVPAAKVHGLYFIGIGAGFIMVELYLIKKFILVFGDPTVSLTFVLACLLSFASIGSMMSSKIPGSRLLPILGAIIAALAATLGLSSVWIEWILRLPLPLAYPVALLILAPVGTLMGIPFPLGMRTLIRSPAGYAYAWAANGSASVCGSILAAQMAIVLGLSAIWTAAAAAYSLALLSLLSGRGVQT